MFNKKKKTIEVLKKRLIELEEKQYSNDKIIKALEQELYNKELKYYKKYDYAILVNGIKVKIWNNDRFEEKVRGITFNCYECEVPEINIIK